jgi:hypothetical protein
LKSREKFVNQAAAQNPSQAKKVWR